MFAQKITIDHTGRITLPRRVLDVLGVPASREIEVVIEVTKGGVIIKPDRSTTPITARIAAMQLPVADWSQMKQEIETGRLA